MKKMTREEAIEKVRKMSLPKETVEILEALAPELRESEDERIRKEIIYYILYKASGISEEQEHAWITYLEKQKEQNGEDEECTDFTIFHPLKIGKGEYKCIPYSFYGSLTSFSEDKDLIDFLRTCFYTKEECEEWIKKQKEQEPVERWQYVGEVDLKENRAIEILEDYLKWAVSESEQECSYTWNELANAIRLGIDAMKEKKPNIELIQKSWYMEGYHDRKFNKEPKWIIKTGEGGPRYEENPKYGQIIEQKPADDKAFEEWIDGWFKEYKEKAYPQITMDEKEFKNFCRGIRNMYQQKSSEWSKEDKDIINEVASILINDENRADNKKEEDRLAYLAEKNSIPSSHAES